MYIQVIQLLETERTPEVADSGDHRPMAGGPVGPVRHWFLSLRFGCCVVACVHK